MYKNLDMKLNISKKSVIYVAGGFGMVGDSVYKCLKKRGYLNVYRNKRKQLDLLDSSKLDKFLKKMSPSLVIFCAAKVGGIKANNDYKAEFMYKNVQMSSNIIHYSYLNKIKNLIYMGSSCIYPRKCKQPISENYLLNGKLESTNEAYALAKISGIKMCEFYSNQYNLNYVGLMPSNLYGINDNYDVKYGHVIPALIQKLLISDKKKNTSLNVWGNGAAKREFLYVDDLAEAIVSIFNQKLKYPFYNVGSGEEISIKKLVLMIKDIYNKKLNIKFTGEESNGTPRKILDSSKIRSFGWSPKISLSEGLTRVMSSKGLI